MNRNLKLGNIILYITGEIENQSRIKLARFSDQNTRLFTYVDDMNQMYINKIENSKNFYEILNPFQQQFAISQNDISCIVFSFSENEIINGSSKGIIT